jgi:hypothetical protein
MKVKDVQSGVEFDAEIEALSKEDFKTIKQDVDRFAKFDWSEYKEGEVYKLKLKNGKEILGLMCIIDHTDPQTNAIEIELLEVAAENVGKNKKIENIGGCLIAFACRESIKRGHEGFVFLIPKTDLIKHYIRYYGFEHVPLRTPGRPEGFLVLYEHISRGIVEKYLR